ncbi:S9 family peptidase [Salinimicrobium catena]|uniref:S9 family peptidase n=1 Tax=Salinimicrobium catena TaxID=390640 RepID=UPI002FE4C54B
MKRCIPLLLFFLAHTLFAQQNVLIPQDVAKLEIVTEAVISPNGNHIAYQKLVPAAPTEENAPASMHLYIYDRDAKSSNALVTDYSVSNIKFRPGKNTLTFAAKQEQDSATAIYEIPVSGGAPTKIFEFGSAIASFDWHSSGDKIAFVAYPVKEDTTSQLPYHPEIYETDLKNANAFVAEMNDPTLKKLEVDGHITAVQWSPKGEMIAVSAAPSSLVDDFYTGQKLYLVDANSLNVAAEVDHKAKMGQFKWSPDGNKIAFIAGEDENDPIDGRIFIAESTGGSPKILQGDFKGKFEGLTWKDEKTLLYLASEGVYSSLGSMGMDGKTKELFKNQNMHITGFSVANDNSIAFTGNTAQHPGELFFLKSGAKSAERLTTSNPWLEEETLGKQEVITYKAEDGLEIQGILIHPVTKSGKTPLITVVHGGPEAHYSNGWLTSYSMPGQMGAGEGYAIFYPNYRGSTGRGVEFAKSSQGDPGGKEFDDIIHGIDHLIADYGIDKDKVGVTGGSYGGYATAWMSTRHTDRFAAGVMSVGISNNISKWGTSDIPEEMFLVHSRKRIWDDYQFFLERSPIFYADQAKTPLLIMHGKEDTRVDPGQSYELYRHIKTRTDTPVRLVLYPGEGHGNRKSTARYDFSLRMMRWFNTYLKNGNAEMPQPALNLQSR